MKALSYSSTATKTGEVSLDKAIFDITPNRQLILEAYQNYLANQRTNNAATLTRGLVSGGGKKPWRQKGTGRARSGSSRNPIWRGGGITFGPTGNENYKRKMSKNQSRLAVIQALSAKAKQNCIVVIEEFKSSEGKVKPTLNVLNKLSVEGNVVIVVDQKTDLLDRATRNIAGVELTSAQNLNIFEVLNADKLIITKKALEVLKNRLSNVKVGASK